MGKLSQHTIEFTKETLAALPFPVGGERWYHDAGCRGLVLRVRAKGTRPSGDKTFYLNARIDGDATKRWIGPLESLTVSKARVLAGEKRQEVIRDRAAENAPKLVLPSTQGETLQQAFDRFIVDRRRKAQTGEIKERTLYGNESAFKRHVTQRDAETGTRLAATPIETIDANWLEALRNYITNEDKSPISANRMMAMMSALFKFVYKKKSLNPCRDVERNPEKDREVFFSDDELGRFLSAIDEYEREPLPKGLSLPTDPATWPDNRGDKPRTAEAMESARAKWRIELAERIAEIRASRRDAADILRVLAWTGQRSGNVRGMRWQDVNLKARTWTIPRELFKGDRTHVARLPAPIVEMLERRQPDPAKRVGYVFPPATNNAKTPYRTEYRPAWKRVLKIAHLDKGGKKFRPHDLRATFATGMHNDGEDVLTISKTLGHSTVAVTERYCRGDSLEVVGPAVDRRAKRMQKIAKGIKAA